MVAEVIQELLPAQRGFMLDVYLTIFHSSTSTSYIESAKTSTVYDHIYVSDDIDGVMPLYSTTLLRSRIDLISLDIILTSLDARRARARYCSEMIWTRLVTNGKGFPGY